MNKKDMQHRATQKGGGQMVGGMKGVSPAKVPAFQGKSGQGDNQSTSRPAGKT